MNNKMNIVIVPFHDWRKIILEGSRTRDAHFIEEYRNQANGTKVIINRPTTFLEIVLKRKPNLLKYNIILERKDFKLYQIDEGFYLIDYVSKNIFSQILGQYIWFINQYKTKSFVSFINEALKKLNIDDNYCLLNQNIFAYKLSKALTPKISIFDAWDNFLKFEVYKKVKRNIKEGYKTYGNICDFWITNSKDNINSFSKPFKPKKIYLVNNGVDLKRFSSNSGFEVPIDIKQIPRPIVGFGGKITHLIDVDLLNETMRLSKSVSFVFVGQILNKETFKTIDKLDNFYYLGDKHYDEYPNYVKSFDICIVPYITDESKKSGANTIKVYEYLSTNKKVIGTPSNGLEDLEDYLYVIKNAKEFSKEINIKENQKKQIDVTKHSWKYKLKQLNEAINEYQQCKAVN